MRVLKPFQTSVENWPPVPGEMSARIGAFDWENTPLGPPGDWTVDLSIAVEHMLSYGFPTTLQWGPEAILLYNDAYIPLIGARHPAALGRSIFQTFPEIRATYEPLFLRVRGGETVFFEDLPYRYVRDDRPVDTWFNMSYSPVRDRSGGVAGVMAIGFETTARVALCESEARYRTLFENIDDGCMIIEQIPPGTGGLRDYRYVLMNSASTSMFGLPDLTGQTIRANFPAEDEEWYDSFDRVIENGSPMRLERFFSSPRMLLEMFLARVGDPARRQLLVLMRNVTEQRRAQESLRQNEKLAAVGRLASSIAHEINNPLEAITNLVYLARGSDVSPGVAELLDQADRQLRRVSLITSETLRFHRQTSEPSRTDLAALLNSILLLHESRLEQSQITIARRYGSHPEVLCLPGEIRQVLANLITNAIEAMAAETDRRILSLRLHGVTDRASGDPGVFLTVSDTGSGIPDAARPHVFEPFFTTREATNSGLGLWISREIVLKHHGRLRFRTRPAGPHRGTAFTLFLPANPSAYHALGEKSAS